MSFAARAIPSKRKATTPDDALWSFGHHRLVATASLIWCQITMARPGQLGGDKNIIIGGTRTGHLARQVIRVGVQCLPQHKVGADPCMSATTIISHAATLPTRPAARPVCFITELMDVLELGHRRWSWTPSGPPPKANPRNLVSTQRVASGAAEQSICWLCAGCLTSLYRTVQDHRGTCLRTEKKAGRHGINKCARDSFLDAASSCTPDRSVAAPVWPILAPPIQAPDALTR
ncbi:uncharacterized protein RCC_10876 [Ramularia collo-cygni]|uniref:Uncharacterized protein n=1 Tax=Ramularia collo-cygni TaxID=112498 RepID=A0A2D3V4C7_9PEZI|nr:uncharacterized protein RCC_10876 [Ramularia collo-cygni]CZT25147.1 uncharacterized protein RCC_10876 [Ramularia collo-cygni]